MTTEKTREEQLQEIGQCAMACIREMVAPLQVDRERLKELREERDEFTIENPGYPDEEVNGTDESIAAWAKEYPDDAEELDALESACKIDGDEVDEEQARERIMEDPLSLQVRGDWHAPGDEDGNPVEYELLLSTGGHATRIIGELNNGEPTSARLQAQDWFTPWTDYRDSAEDQAALMAYVQCFYFGD